jgi:hypothetical protein
VPYDLSAILSRRSPAKAEALAAAEALAKQGEYSRTRDMASGAATRNFRRGLRSCRAGGGRFDRSGFMPGSHKKSIGDYPDLLADRSYRYYEGPAGRPNRGEEKLKKR